MKYIKNNSKFLDTSIFKAHTLNLDMKHVGAIIDVKLVHVVLLNDGRRVRNANMPFTRIIIAR